MCRVALYIINACGQQKLGEQLLNKQHEHISQIMNFEDHMIFNLGRNISLLVI